MVSLISEIQYNVITKDEIASHFPSSGSTQNSYQRVLWSFRGPVIATEWCTSSKAAISSLGLLFLLPATIAQQLTILDPQYCYRKHCIEYHSVWWQACSYRSQRRWYDFFPLQTSEKPDGLHVSRLIPFGFEEAIFCARIYLQQAFFTHFACELETKFCLLESYQIVGPEESFFDPADKQLNCVRLLCCKKPVERYNVSVATKIGLVPCDIIQSWARVVPATVGLQVITSTTVRIGELQQLSEQEKWSCSILLDPSRFFLPKL